MSNFGVLPVELQREVFEWASVDSERPVNTAMTLSYVCHRVKIWMDYIYRDIFLEDGVEFYKFLDTFNAKPADFFRDRVYSLCLDCCQEEIAEDAIRIVQTCSNLRSLWWRYNRPTNGQRLNLNFVAGHSHLQTGSFIGHEVTVALASQPFLHPWRQSLRILDIVVEDAFDINFNVFPSLTSISLSLWSDHFSGDGKDFTKLFTKLLERPRLECLVLGFDGTDGYWDLKNPEHLRDLGADFSDTVIRLEDIRDPRLVSGFTLHDN
ncbi:hypothetical protein D9758_010023 [Tetrapyrgos nigripes]|uniref:F-box domain-containing protein n=1 Tax=Tetrapyrgos nigripes TaxID=182062 RepID=A0A8H5CVF1_9AGAR|nr:hypothetical protein D9758_010023 [Tetrapyrgos nigripes]